MEQMKNILWIDDDIRRGELSTDIDEFQDNGFTIVKAENPDEVDEIIEKRKDFVCIIVDISMPLGKTISFGEAKGGMRTGLVVLKRLMNNKDLSNIKKVVFTIVDDDEVRNYCEENTIPYLEKQKYLTDTFVEKITQMLSE